MRPSRGAVGTATMEWSIVWRTVVGRWGRVRGRVLVTIAALGAVVVPPAAVAAPAPCATVMPVEDLVPGMTGTGLTVVSGDEPESFAVEVLGVLPDAVGPGRDLVVVDANSSSIAAAGGVWSGMSGSPVYVQGKLVGAVAWGFSYGPTSIVGVTPAADMLDLTAGVSRSTAAVALDSGQRRQLAAAAGLAASDVPSGLHRLPLPLSLSGVPSRLFGRVVEALERTGLGLVPHAGTATGAGATTTVDPSAAVPGGNLAAVMAAGDLTAAAVGTITEVCQGGAIGFGHPFLFSGRTELAAASAPAIAVVDDPFGPFKLTTIGPLLGTIDQDRLAGLHVDLGTPPRGTPVTSSVHALERDRARDGHTDVYHSDWLADLAAMSVVVNVDSVQDRYGGGSALVNFTVTGVDASGTPWRLVRQNRTTSPYDISYEVPFELYLDLMFLQYNPFEPVEITSVDADVDVSETPHRLAIEQVLVSTDDGASWSEGPDVFATAGGQLLARVTLRDAITGATRDADLTVEVPAGSAYQSGSLDIAGGQVTGDPWECMFDPAACVEPGTTTLDDLLDVLSSKPRRDDLVGTLVLYGGGVVDGDAPVDGEAGAEPRQVTNGDGEVPIASRATVRVDQVVEGQRSLSVWVEPSGDDGPSGPTIDRVAGADRVETAVALAGRAFPGGVGTVVLTRADAHADALAAAPLAARLGGPVLLTDGDLLSAPVRRELARLRPRDVIVVGGEDAVSPAVVRAVRSTGARVTRIAGANRFDTARLVAMRLGGDRVYVVEGADPDPARGWPDAVAVAGLAAMQQRPVLLVETDVLPAETATALRDLTAVGATIVGGPVAVSARVADEVDALVRTVDRVAGTTRYATSARLADRAMRAGADPLRLFVATGRAFPDALAAGPVAAASAGVILLVDGFDPAGAPETAAWIGDLAGQPVDVTLIGGHRAISVAVRDAIGQWLGGGDAEG